MLPHASHNIGKLTSYIFQSSCEKFNISIVLAYNHSKAVILVLNCSRLATNAERFFQIINLNRKHHVNRPSWLELHVLKPFLAFLAELKNKSKIIRQIISFLKFLLQRRLIIQKRE